ncbi:phage minor head protein [Pasteurella sp. PK-2025]|uniref:phage minor head protein n=1 Tax=Pasteurella sp. PK-2025 TaxID=3413133 RepID=UPI003C723364
MKNNMTVDEQLEHLLTDHKILLFRYDASLRKEIVKKLNEMQRKMILRISSVGIESLSKRELVKLLSEIKEIIKEYYQTIYHFTNDELQALLPIEALAVREIYNTAVKFDLFNKIPDYKLKANKTAQIVAGSPLSDWFDKQGGDLTFKLTGLIRQGILDGKQTSAIITEVKDLLGSSRRSAETLVRTAVMKVNDEAHKLLRDENEDIIKGEQHISTLDTRTSEVCRVRDGLAWDLNQKPIGDHNIPYQRPPLHPNCLLGDTDVLSRCGVSAAFKRWFEGEIVIIKTASGFELSTTPNHPILTRQGWIASDELNVGSYVVCDGVGQWRDRRNWNDKNVPTSIKQLTSSFLMSSKMFAVSMPISPVDFHGDGIDGDIAIVATNRFLMNTLNTSLFEHFHQNILKLGRVSFCFLNRRSFSSQNIGCCFLPSSSNMGFTNELLPFFLRSNSHSSELLLASISCINTILLQDKFNGSYRDSEFLVNSVYTNTRIEQIYNILMSFIDVSQNNVCIAHQLFCFCSDLYRVICEQSNNNLTGNIEVFGNICGAFPRFIKSNDFIRRQCSNSSFSDSNSIFLNDSIQNEVRDIELAHNLIEGNIIKVFFDQVVSIERECFSGHVYNLETKDGWYIANGILTHNCRSTMRLITKSWRELGFDVDEIPESTRASMDGQVKENITYEDWLKNKTKAQQDEILGKGKADLWRNGVITFRDMLDQSGRPLTLKELKEKYES